MSAGQQFLLEKIADHCLHLGDVHLVVVLCVKMHMAGDHLDSVDELTQSSHNRPDIPIRATWTCCRRLHCIWIQRPSKHLHNQRRYTDQPLYCARAYAFFHTFAIFSQHVVDPAWRMPSRERQGPAANKVTGHLEPVFLIKYCMQHRLRNHHLDVVLIVFALLTFWQAQQRVAKECLQRLEHIVLLGLR